MIYLPTRYPCNQPANGTSPKAECTGILTLIWTEVFAITLISYNKKFWNFGRKLSDNKYFFLEMIFRKGSEK